MYDDGQLHIIILKQHLQAAIDGARQPTFLAAGARRLRIFHMTFYLAFSKYEYLQNSQSKTDEYLLLTTRDARSNLSCNRRRSIVCLLVLPYRRRRAAAARSRHSEREISDEDELYKTGSSRARIRDGTGPLRGRDKCVHSDGRFGGDLQLRAAARHLRIQLRDYGKVAVRLGNDDRG